MKRLFIYFSLLAVFFMSACDRRWNGVIIKKRTYMDGYYVHVPSRRSTDPQENPKPSPYPVGSGRTGIARTRFDTAAVADQPVYPQARDSVNGRANGTATSTRNYPGPYGYGNGSGNGNFPGPQPDTGKPSSGYVNQHPNSQNDSVPPSNIADQPAPNDSLVPDTLIAQQDSVAPPDSLVAKNDPPRKRRHLNGNTSVVFAAGLLSPQQDYGYPVKWNSFAAGTGLRYTMKVKKKDRIVLDLGYRLNHFSIAQERRKAEPFTQEKHDREKISVHDFSGAVCTRFNFAAPDDQPERWLDIGLYGDNAFHTSNVYTDKRYNLETADREIVRTKLTGLHYMNRWDYGFTARYSCRYFNFFAMWRLSDLVENGSQEAYHRDLPRLIVGLEWNLGAE